MAATFRTSLCWFSTFDGKTLKMTNFEDLSQSAKTSPCSVYTLVKTPSGEKVSSQMRWTCEPPSGDNQSQVSSCLCRASCDSCSKALIKVNYKLYEKKPIRIKKSRFNLSILLCVQQLISGFVVLAFEPWLKMKLTLPSSAPELLINLQTIYLCFLSVFTAACAKTTASIIFIPYFFKTRQKNKKKTKTKQRRWDVSMHRCRFSIGVFVHLSLRRRQLLGASCDTSMSLYPSFYAQSPACCFYPSPACLPAYLRIKKKKKSVFSLQLSSQVSAFTAELLLLPLPSPLHKRLSSFCAF